jgi:hypothetical protein
LASSELWLLPSLSLGEGRGHICLYNPIHFSSGNGSSIVLWNNSNTDDRANNLFIIVQEKKCMLTPKILQSMKGLRSESVNVLATHDQFKTHTF